MNNTQLQQTSGVVNFTFTVMERPKLQIQVLATDPREGLYWIDQN